MVFRTTSYYFKSLQSLVKDETVCCIRKGEVWTICSRKRTVTFRNPAFGLGVLHLRVIQEGKNSSSVQAGGKEKWELVAIAMLTVSEELEG